ncbi:hypothetical protein LCGC14_2815400, partial [marine sediment metagenome]
HGVLSDDPNFNELAVANVAVTVFDDDAPNLIILETDNSTAVLEGTNGAITDQYTVQLSSSPDPGEIVTVTLVHDSQIDVSSDNLTFTDANWNVPQTVTVSAVLDGLPENTFIAGIVHQTSTAGGASYAGVAEASLEVTVYDGDSPGVLATESEGSTLVVEGGHGDQYDLRLTSQPAGAVTVEILTDGQALVSSSDSRFNAGSDTEPPSVTFTPSNWWMPATIEVSANPNFEPNPAQRFVKHFPIQPHTVNRIRGPLVIEGGASPDRDRSLKLAVILPAESTDPPLQPEIVDVGDDVEIDFLQVMNDSSVFDDVGRLSYRADITTPAHTLTGLDMGGDLTVDMGTADPNDDVTFSGGITYNELEVLEISLGTGNDSFEVTSTPSREDAFQTWTMLNSGDGDDVVTV